jgi:eukaryotic-like serine/threonine-protein kinase
LAKGHCAFHASALRHQSIVDFRAAPLVIGHSAQRSPFVTRNSTFVIPRSGIGHWTLVIGHSPRARRGSVMTNRKCARCGLTFASDKLEGMCPACLLNATFDAEAVSPDEGPAFWEDTPATPKKTPARTFSHFEILDELGRGGMGVVYRARDLNTERIVALKVLQAHHLEVDDLVQRFRSEVRAVSSLDHAHVLPIHEVGEHDGIPFFSMKLTTGGSLAHSLGNYLGKPREAAQLLAKVSRGVHHAHERGILHRDLKPGNILLDAAGEPYVCDFGLAKWLEDDKKLTMTAAVLGTPHYIAPEQAAGNKGLTTAVDIYSLGAILYELLTGRPPFVGGSVLETLVASQEKTPERPSSIARNVPKDLETICLKALQHDPNNRYATAKAFAEDLEAWLAGRPIQARPVGAAEQLWRWAKRNPLPATLIAALIITLTAIAIGASIFAVRIEHARRRAVDAETIANQQLYASRLAHARASRLSREAGHRLDALAAIKQAASSQPTLELRNEAIAALCLVDMSIRDRVVIRENSYPVSFSGDLSQIITTQSDGTIVLRTFPTLQPIRTFRTGAVPLATAHSGSRYLAARHFDGRVQIWDLQNPARELHLVSAPNARPNQIPIRDFGFDPQQTKIVVAGVDGGFSVYRIGEVTPLFHFGADEHATVFAFSMDGQWIASCGKEDLLKIWNAETGALETKIALPAGASHLTGATIGAKIAWNPNGHEIAVGGADNNIYLIDRKKSAVMATLRGHTIGITQILYNHAGSLLASTAQDKTIRLWDSIAQSELVSLSDFGAEPVLQFSEDDQFLGATDYARTAVRIQIVGLDRPCISIASPVSGDVASLVSSIDFTPDAQSFGLSSFGGVFIRAVSTGQLLAGVLADKKIERNLSYREHTDEWLVCSKDDGVKGYKIAADSGTLTPTSTYFSRADFIFGTRPNGASAAPYCVTSKTEGIVVLLSPSTLKELRSIDGHPQIWDACANTNGSLVVASFSGASPSNPKVIDVQNGKVIAELPIGPSGTVAFSADSTRIIASGIKGVGVWTAPQWTAQLELPHMISSEASRGEYNADQSLIAFPQADKIHLVNTKTRQTVATLTSSVTPSPKYRIRFSPIESTLIAQGSNCNVRIWKIAALRSQLAEYNLDW